MNKIIDIDVFADLKTLRNRFNRLMYWNHILGFDTEKPHQTSKTNLFFQNAGEDVDQFVKTNYSNELNKPEVQARILGNKEKI